MTRWKTWVCVLVTVWLSSTVATAAPYYEDANLGNTSNSFASEQAPGAPNWWWRSDSGFPGWPSDTSVNSDHMYSNAKLPTSLIQPSSALSIDFNAAGLGPNQTADVWIVWGEFENNTDGIKWSTSPINTDTDGSLLTRTSPEAEEIDNLSGIGTPVPSPGDIDGHGSRRFRANIGPLTADGSGIATLYVGIGQGPSTYFDGAAVGVPEPATCGMAALGLAAGLGLFARRRRRQL